MKKKIIAACALGAFVGLSISYLITIMISVCVGDGTFYAVVPELIDDCGGELNAVLIQAACSLLYGAAWAGAGFIWQAEGWSLLKMTAVHFAVCSTATLPIAYFMRWMQHSLGGVATYFAIFAAIYALVWLVQYLVTGRRLRRINERMDELKDDEE